MYFYSFLKQCEFFIFRNNPSGFIQEERDATKLEMGKNFIGSGITLSATIDNSTVDLICDMRVKEKWHKTHYIKNVY